MAAEQGFLRHLLVIRLARQEEVRSEGPGASPKVLSQAGQCVEEAPWLDV